MRHSFLQNVSEVTHTVLCPEMCSMEYLKSIDINTSGFFMKYQLSLKGEGDVEFNRQQLEESKNPSLIVKRDKTNNINSDILYTVLSVDPASGGRQSARSALIVVAYLKNGMRIPIWLVNKSMKSPELKRTIIDLWGTFNCNYVIVEGNAFQVSLTDELRVEHHLFEAMGYRNTMRIVSCFTGKNKNDPELGVSTLTGLFDSHSIMFPDGDYFSKEMFAPLFRELTMYPGKYTDCVMALWFNEVFMRNKVRMGNSSGVSVIRRELRDGTIDTYTKVPTVRNIFDFINNNKNTNENKTRKKFSLPDGTRPHRQVRLPIGTM